MAYDQGAGPSTPGRSFASAGRPSDMLQSQQQRTPSGGNSSSFGTFGSNVNIARSSSMRSIPAAQSGNTSTFGFGGMRESSAAPKTVRWEDAPSTPIQEQQTPSIYPHLGSSLQNFNFQTSHSAQIISQYQTPSYQSNSQSANQFQSTSFQPNATQSNSSSLQLQKTPPQQQYSSFSNSFSSPITLSNASKSQEPRSSSSALQQTPSVFNRVTAKGSQSLSYRSPAQQSSPVAPRSSAPPKADTMASTVVLSRPAVLSRIKWNVLAMLACWLVPRFSLMGRVYWTLLDLSFSLFGGDADVHVATSLSWLRKASTVILFINIMEAVIMLNTHSDATALSPSSASPIKRKPSLANPPNRIASASQPSSSSPSPSVTKRNTPRQYAHNSPLRESIFRASASAQGLGEGRRMPSETPRLSSSSRKGSGASPLAAFLARKQERIASGADIGDMSFDGEADLSTDSIEVDRALRAFSADYEREVSQSRSINGTEGQQTAIAV